MGAEEHSWDWPVGVPVREAPDVRKGTATARERADGRLCDPAGTEETGVCWVCLVWFCITDLVMPFKT